MAVLVRRLLRLPWVPRVACWATPRMLAAMPVPEPPPTVMSTLALTSRLARGSCTEQVMVATPAWLPAWKWKELPPALEPSVMLRYASGLPSSSSCSSSPSR